MNRNYSDRTEIPAELAATFPLVTTAHYVRGRDADGMSTWQVIADADDPALAIAQEVGGCLVRTKSMPDGMPHLLGSVTPSGRVVLDTEKVTTSRSASAKSAKSAARKSAEPTTDLAAALASIDPATLAAILTAAGSAPVPSTPTAKSTARKSTAKSTARIVSKSAPTSALAALDL